MCIKLSEDYVTFYLVLYVKYFIFLAEPSPSESESLVTFLNNISEHEEISCSDMLKKEISTYIAEKNISAKDCILKWWNENSSRYATLARVAKNILGIPATQVYSERLFSLAGNVVTQKRTCLLTERVEHICFLSANLKI